MIKKRIPLSCLLIVSMASSYAMSMEHIKTLPEDDTTAREESFEDTLPANVKWRPSSYPGVTWLTSMFFVEDVPKAAKFYQKVFGMSNIFDKLTSEDGITQEDAPVFVRLRFRGSNICIFKKGVQFFPEEMALGKDAKPSVLTWMYLDDSDDDEGVNAVDALFKKAVANGCEKIKEPEDQFWGDRVAYVKDPFGYYWAFGKKIEK